MAMLSSMESSAPLEQPSQEESQASQEASTVADEMGAVRSPKEVKVRKDFAETLAWETIEISHLDPKRKNGNSKRGKETINIKAPESITSYIISGVTMSSKFGLGLPSARPALKVFQPFFIQMTFPFSVKRDERLRQEILIFSYLPDAQQVTVTIEANPIEVQFSNPELNGWQGELSYKS